MEIEGRILSAYQGLIEQKRLIPEGAMAGLGRWLCLLTYVLTLLYNQGPTQQGFHFNLESLGNVAA